MSLRRYETSRTGVGTLSGAERSRLLRTARDVLKQAYAPYSHFRVGAAVLTANGGIFAGCNVENSSYGLTICAERAAVFTGVTHEGAGEFKIRALAVVCEAATLCTPCGACRQVISEFSEDASAIILFEGEEGAVETTIGILLPDAFRLTGEGM